jgi:SAM-dependent methyltransferase
MQAYGPVFAQVYNRYWRQFSTEAAPKLRALYQSCDIAIRNRLVLDLGCGVGVLAAHFLEHGYEVIGVDQSEAMLALAQENLRVWLDSGQANLLHCDFRDVRIARRAGLVVSTFDAMNHLPDVAALRQALANARANMEPVGLLAFDLNTRFGLQRWTNVTVDETADSMIVARGVCDPAGGKAWARISGFTRIDGEWRRFEETLHNTGFAMDDVAEVVRDAGFKDFHFTGAQDRETPVSNPEEHARVWVIATAPE